MAKTYTVMKDGEELKELKTLAAAKKLADAEDAKVFCEGLCVYAPDPPVGGDKPEISTPQPEKYILTAKMNIRKSPGRDADKLGIAQKGAVVEVAAVENDWLCLTDGTFILYEDGKWAVKKQ